MSIPSGKKPRGRSIRSGNLLFAPADAVERSAAREATSASRRIVNLLRRVSTQYTGVPPQRFDTLRGGAGPARYGVPSGWNQRAVPSLSLLTPHPYSCTSLWWNVHTRRRLSRSVGPPFSHQWMWWATVNLRAPHPGNRHSLSRYRRWRIIHEEGSRPILPRPRRFPEKSWITVWTRESQRSLLAVSGWITGPPSSSHPPSPEEMASRWAWTTTVARSGSASAAIRAEHRATRASALLASTWQGSSSPGITGTFSARRSRAFWTTAPSAAGSSAWRPNLLFSSKYHHERDRAFSASRVSWIDRWARSPLCLMAPQDTCLAHLRRSPSFSGAANLVSSTTLSIPSSPEDRAASIRGRLSRAWAAAIHRPAFQWEIPRRIFSQWAISLAPESFHAFSLSTWAMRARSSRWAEHTFRWEVSTPLVSSSVRSIVAFTRTSSGHGGG